MRSARATSIGSGDPLALYAEFGVLRQLLLIIGVVPLATIGGLLALHLIGTTLNVASGVGFIALFGVAGSRRC